jgi:hypothetical protein
MYGLKIKRALLQSFYSIFIFLMPVAAFSQIPNLILKSTDIRVNYAEYNGVNGYDVYIREKTGIESVMLTEPSGEHALRAMEWNAVNGNEKRNISGVTLAGAYSQYSIVSSTTQPDYLFGSVFHLFLPSMVVYGNPSSPMGTVYRDITSESQINIRTFDHKYADPKQGRFQNNHNTIGNLLYSEPIPSVVSERTPVNLDRIVIVRSYLQEILIYNKFLESIKNDELKQFLIDTFGEKDREQQSRK